MERQIAQAEKNHPVDEDVETGLASDGDRLPGSLFRPSHQRKILVDLGAVIGMRLSTMSQEFKEELQTRHAALITEMSQAGDAARFFRVLKQKTKGVYGDEKIAKILLAITAAMAMFNSINEADELGD